jgi:DNA-binding transcriptional ArsR family regulator
LDIYNFIFIQMDMETVMDQFVKVMKALSDANRVMIIKMLRHKTLCVCEIQKALDISQGRYLQGMRKRYERVRFAILL